MWASDVVSGLPGSYAIFVMASAAKPRKGSATSGNVPLPFRGFAVARKGDGISSVAC